MFTVCLTEARVQALEVVHSLPENAEVTSMDVSVRKWNSVICSFVESGVKMYMHYMVTRIRTWLESLPLSKEENFYGLFCHKQW